MNMIWAELQQNGPLDIHNVAKFMCACTSMKPNKRIVLPRTYTFFKQTVKTPFRLHRCWSELSLVAHGLNSVLLWCGSSICKLVTYNGLESLQMWAKPRYNQHLILSLWWDVKFKPAVKALSSLAKTRNYLINTICCVEQLLEITVPPKSRLLWCPLNQVTLICTLDQAHKAQNLPCQSIW